MRMSFNSAATAIAIVTHILYQSCTVAADNTIHLVRASSKYKFHRNNRPIHTDTCASIRIRHNRKNSISAFQLPVSIYPGLFKGRESKRKFRSYHQAPYKYPINHLNISQEFRSVQNLNHLRNSAPTGSGTRLFSTGSSSVASSSSLPSIRMLHFNSVKSTQDEARRILNDKDKHVPHEALAITASSQTNGRGTNGRSWIGQTGNVFLTIAIPSDDLVIPLTLFPLQIGTLLTQRVSDMLNHKNIDVDVEDVEKVQDAKVTVKWPNDVLVNQKKIAGVLIESDQDHSGCYYYLVGIGINYKYAPMVNTTGSQMGRESTCICDYIPSISTVDEDENENENDATSTAKAMELGQNVARDVMDWVKLQKSWDGAADAIVPNWERHFECGTKLIMRDDPNQEVVMSVGIEKDGQLRVKGMNGVERLLCSDYLL